MCLLASYKKKILKTKIFLASMELDPDPEADPDPDPLVRGTDPGIRTKMSRIPNTAFKKCSRIAEIVMAEYCASLYH
jgi:hypothetical protein